MSRVEGRANTGEELGLCKCETPGASYLHARGRTVAWGAQRDVYRPGRLVRTDWEEVYRSTYEELFRFLSWMLWDEDQAKDLVQEAFIRVIDQDPESPRALLFRVASNLARDQARLVVRRKRHLTLLRVEADVNAEGGATPASDLQAREDAERLRQALQALSDSDREVILLWNAGMSYAEIADQTGLSLGAIGTTVARAKKKLVNALQALGRRDAALG